MLFASLNPPDEGSGLIGFVLNTIDQLGEIGVGALILLESLVPPIPSEVVLPAAGALIYFGDLSGPLTMFWATLGSLLGALILYGAGRAFGEERTRRVMLAVPLIDSDDVDRADAWFSKHGEKAVLIGRLIPGVRSLVSLPAGAAGMPLGRFVLLTTIGSAVWNLLLIGSGWLLGTQYHVIEEHIDTANNIIYVLIGASIAVFIMRRLNRGRRAAP
ncbi:MAG: DedA family protein [Actinobacteria bacterium]|nr:DedA family protein [Micrococcales bacterium]MCB0903388.1 DedA family protein [Actinomycetota bacterium]MCO5300130.1 DedA family protein [Candidatus Nanopelagicales bacterium]MCB9429353.1 DedA family protein [Actinomycetota bacterium]HPE11719.1 DedA family protein [Actinomycetota bacterium]